MLISPSLLAILIVIKLLVGFLIGLAVTALMYRSRLGPGLAIRGALFAGVAFLIASGIAGWAGSHAAFENGQRMDVAPWGENLWLRNRIADNELLICTASSVITALLAGVRFGRARRINRVR
jgi:hypothetical protein